MIVVLTGGTGGAKFVDGLRQVVSAKSGPSMAVRSLPTMIPKPGMNVEMA